MRFVTVRDLRQKGKEIWGKLQSGEEAVLTHNGSPVALLIGVREEELEEMMRIVKRARAEAAVRRMRESARWTGIESLSIDEIEAEIGAARQERRP